MTVRSNRSCCGTARLYNCTTGSIATEIDSFLRFSYFIAMTARVARAMAFMYTPVSGLRYIAISESTGTSVMSEMSAYFLRSAVISFMVLLAIAWVAVNAFLTAVFVRVLSCLIVVVCSTGVSAISTGIGASLSFGSLMSSV